MSTSNNSVLARLSLEGLSIGDAFGQQFFYPGVLETASPDRMPVPPWEYTDDTEMAIALTQTLEEYQEINQDVLAQKFAERFLINPHRGYGAGARELLISIARGADWKSESHGMFGGSGSYGN
ncbi:MAG: ADP-ribosylglycohydrolase family protein [Planctomycetaceae bacterium]|nr:ADP-ribosylglycohydrolase family protein [Planctomycetaceae bacterium]